MLSLVNFGAAPVATVLRGFSSVGGTIGGAAPGTSIPASQQYLKAAASAFSGDTANLSWVRVDAPGTQLVGAQVLSDGTYFDALPAAPQASIGPWIVTVAEQSENTSTQLMLTNPGTQTASIYIYAQSADGAVQDSYTGQLAPKQQSSAALTAYFASLPATFHGYAMVFSDQPITVAEELIGPTTRAALNAQIPQTDRNSTLYAPRLGGPSGVTMLTLVNQASVKASITVKGFGPNGSAVGTPATFSLAAGLQYRSSLSAALHIDDTQAGTLVVTSDQPGLVGHLDLMDPIGKAFRATLPLDAAPAKSMAIPYVAQSANSGTSLSISNAGSSPANVTLKAFATNGTAMGTRNRRTSR
jgi:hypothetical protein